MIKELELDQLLEKSYDYLELGEIPEDLYNPLANPEFYNIESDPVEEAVKVLTNEDYLAYTAQKILNITLPPYQMVILDTFWKKRFPMIVASRGASKCVTGNSLCRTSNGLLRMDEIVSKYSAEMTRVSVDCKMYGENGYNKPAYGWNNGITDTIKITDNFGYQLEGTHNHPIRVLENGEIVWKNIEDIEEGDTVVINRDLYNFGNDETIDEDMAWFIGAVIGDGMTSQRSIVNFTTADQDILDEYTRISKEKFGYTPRKVSSAKYAHNIYSVNICKYLNDTIGLGGKKAHGKSIPLIIRKSKRNVVASFLRGLMDTDGYCSNREVGYSTVSKELAEQVHQCFLAFGIVSRLSDLKSNCNGKTFDSFKIQVCGVENICKYREHIGFVCKRKLDRLEALCNRNSNPNLDLVTDQFDDILISLGNKYKADNTIGGKKYSYERELLSPSRIKSYNVSYKTLGKILDITNSISEDVEWQKLADIKNKNLLFTKIIKIEESSAQTFDVNIPEDHSFISNGFVSHNSFMLAVYALLRMALIPETKIVIVGNGLRQSRQVFRYMEDIWNDAPILRDLAGKSKNIGYKQLPDRLEFRVGSSLCTGIPMGDGDSIRGLRANIIVADEFAGISPDVFNRVVRGFGVVAQRPIDRIKEAAIIKRLRSSGLWSPEMELVRLEGVSSNQIIYSGSAYFSFNHFYKYYEKFSNIIRSKGDAKKLKEIMGDDESYNKGFNWRDYAIIQIPYTAIPDGQMDDAIVTDARVNLTAAQFNMEMGARFQKDSDGFFQRSILELATTHHKLRTPDGSMVQFSPLRIGNPDGKYVIGVDPAADDDSAAIVVLELHNDHRRIVYCWTTNRKIYGKLKKKMESKGILLEDDYYYYIARKIRELMSLFAVEAIVMDKFGGGISIQEALHSQRGLKDGEHAIWPMVDPDDPQDYDGEEGLHILKMIVPSSDLNYEANHGMLKDFQDKALLFPMFDMIELSKSLILEDDSIIETYEQLVQEFEELKEQVTSIVAKPTPTGRETFDTFSKKADGSVATNVTRSKKDRYSALLYANYYSRNRDKNRPKVIEYKPVGSLLSQKIPVSEEKKEMYYGMGMIRMKNAKWNKVEKKRIN